jgi:cob(I)alamin adenosyltransferase
MAEQSVQKCYNQILERSTDKGGLTFWVNFLMNGKSVKDMVRSFAHSEEYRQRFILPYSPVEAAKLAYRHFLAREAENEAVATGHANVLVNHGYAAMVKAFVDSVEYKNRFGDHLVPFK